MLTQSLAIALYPHVSRYKWVEILHFFSSQLLYTAEYYNFSGVYNHMLFNEFSLKDHQLSVTWDFHVLWKGLDLVHVCKEL